MGVTFEDMVVKSMRLYWNKESDHSAMSSTKDSKYNKKYFDGIGKEMVPEGTKLTKPSIIKDDGLGPNFNPPPKAPIPGENYTSDTKNYPWHRPPEVTSIDQGVELAAKQLMSDDKASGLLTMLQAGLPISTATDIFVTSGIGAGKWIPDFAILLAGPVSHIIQLMAQAEGIDADLGIDLPKNTKTISYLNAVKDDQEGISAVYKALDDPEVIGHMEQKVTGIMGAAQQMSQPQESMNEEMK